MSLSPDLFRNNRLKFFDRIPENSAVVLFAGSSRKMSQDSEYRFLPDRNFYYLTGISTENARLIMVRNGDIRDCFLFMPPKDETAERWHGKRMTFAEASRLSGIEEKDILPIGDFEDKLYFVSRDLLLDLCYDGTSISDENASFVKSHDGIKDISSVLTSLRMVKSEEEIEAIRKAAKLTEDALSDMKEMLVAGSCENDCYAALEYGMAKRGSLIPAFSTITAIDGNAFYLHHSDPEGPEGPVFREGSFIQIDVGGRYDGYCADISRVYFIGRGDPQTEKRREALLGLSRKLRAEAFSYIKPGITFKGLNEHMKDLLGKWLVENELCAADADMAEETKKYYWHNTGHHLGLDVHDISDREAPFEAGNCLAIEPGVYIPQWDIGFRIEDDVLVTGSGCELLSSGIDTPESVYIG